MGRELHVLHVIGGLDLGGAETLLYRLATHPSADVRHEVICLGSRGWYSSLLQKTGIVVHHLGMSSPPSALRGIGTLRRLIRSRKPDVIQSWMYFANVLTGLAGRSVGVPVLWSIHATNVGRCGLATRICAYGGGASARWLTNYVVNCSQRSAEVHARLGYSRAPNAVIPNGYDPTVFYPDEDARASARAALGIAGETFVVGSISRWHTDKDVPLLLRAMALAESRGIDACCVLVGRGLDESNSELSGAIERAGLKSRVITLGLRDDVAEILRLLDLHVLSSRTEAFPNVIAESMLCGVPNVTTDVGDSTHIVGNTGWSVPPGDAEGMAGGIEQAYREWREQPDDWQQRREAARQRIIDHFTFDRMVQAYEKLWRELAFASHA
jgi:glycosyltransferase involved in cell wall biosynthesis